MDFRNSADLSPLVCIRVVALCEVVLIAGQNRMRGVAHTQQAGGGHVQMGVVRGTWQATCYWCGLLDDMIMVSA